MNITKLIFRHLIDGINFRHLTDDTNCHVYEQYVMTTNIIKSLAEALLRKSKCTYLGIHMKLTLRNGVHVKLQLQLLRHKCGTAQSPPSTRPALKATSTTHAADTTKGQSGVFLLVEVRGVDDIAGRFVYLTRRWPAKT